jgi:biopolymer transport protein ExbD
MDSKTGTPLTAGVSLAAGLLFSALALWAIVRSSPQAASPADASLKRDAPCEIRIVHEGPPGDHPDSRHRCGDESHWRLRNGDRDVTDPADLRHALRKTPARTVEIQGDEWAPWGFVQGLMRECARAGMDKFGWSRDRVKVWLPKSAGLGSSDSVVLEEIRVFMKWLPSQEATIRKCGNRGMVDSDEDLMAIVGQMVTDYGNAGVVIDATGDVPWGEVFHLVELCRAKNIKTIEFEPHEWER